MDLSPETLRFIDGTFSDPRLRSGAILKDEASVERDSLLELLFSRMKPSRSSSKTCWPSPPHKPDAQEVAAADHSAVAGIFRFPDGRGELQVR